MALQIDNVSVVKNHAILLENVSTRVHQGECLAVLGANGAGKSTLLRAIAGQADYQGSIHIGDVDLADLQPKQIAKHISYVPQQQRLDFELSVKETVALGLLPELNFWASFTREQHQAVEDTLEKFQLSKLAKRNFATLSGGEQQRVFIAQSMLRQAEILLFDEPSNHLDIQFQHDILSRLKVGGRTVILTLHDINLAIQYCDRLLFLQEGRLIFDGKPKDLNETLLRTIYKMPPKITWKGEQIEFIRFVEQAS